ncbi:MAG: zf-HC2 domain-containing protein [Planctomycetes bacterium]|nr:zf-HC2 domain-containing protein [Planctomycetota bacterium]
MISCRTLARLLLGYVEQELPGEYRELVEQHLASCAQCVALADSYTVVLQLVRQLQPVPVPPELLEALRIAAGLDLPFAVLHPPWPEPC